MAKDFLLEIGLEEMPAHVVGPSQAQFEKKVVDFLEENQLNYESIQSFSTPRRLAVQVKNISESQADSELELKGPAKKIALDQEGNWSKAAQGFVKSQGLSTENITFREFKGEEYVYVTKYVKGKSASEVLIHLKEVIMNMTFPVSMHWNNYSFKYIRPIRWLVALLDNEVLPFEILDIKTGQTSQGHRFLGDAVQIPHAKDYEAILAEQFVIADSTKRKDEIVKQMEALAESHHWHLDIDQKLLEEVVNLVEYPTVFAGQFSEKYLSIPTEVLVTSMKEHQRYFEVYSSSNELVPNFIAVRNGDRVHIENVIKGNEKVLTARLEDAEFFFKEDQKLSIDEYVEKLKQVTFHEKIGTIYEKMKRVSKIAQIIGHMADLNKEELTSLERASEIYKFDLGTNMVGEFPELQGVMGEKYALLQGESPEVAKAIREHYLPTSSEGELPVSNIGAVLSIADKLDSLISFFAKGMVPSGSNDPYALRRQAYGIIRMIQDKHWQIPLQTLGNQVKDIYAELSDQEFSVYREVTQFMINRLKQWLTGEKVRYDIIEAVTESCQDDLTKVIESALVIAKHAEDRDFKTTIEALTRVVNLAKKAEFISSEEIVNVQPKLFENEGEQQLYSSVENILQSEQEKSSEELYQDLRNLRTTIEAYFDQTMVMSEDHDRKENRLKQLSLLTEVIMNFASLDLLVVK